MLNPDSKKLIIEKIKYFENAGIDLINLTEDSHFLSELTMFLMVMETEGFNSTDSYPIIYKEVKVFVKKYIKGNDNEI